MKLHVYCILDKAVGAFMNPFYVRSQGEAMRGFYELVNDEKTNIGKYPADFTLMLLGLYDDQSGLFEVHEPARVVTAMEVLNKSIQEEANGRLDRRAM